MLGKIVIFAGSLSLPISLTEYHDSDNPYAGYGPIAGIALGFTIELAKRRNAHRALARFNRLLVEQINKQQVTVASAPVSVARGFDYKLNYLEARSKDERDPIYKFLKYERDQLDFVIDNCNGPAAALRELGQIRGGTIDYETIRWLVAEMARYAQVHKNMDGIIKEITPLIDTHVEDWQKYPEELFGKITPKISAEISKLLAESEKYEELTKLIDSTREGYMDRAIKNQILEALEGWLNPKTSTGDDEPEQLDQETIDFRMRLDRLFIAHAVELLTLEPDERFTETHVSKIIIMLRSLNKAKSEAKDELLFEFLAKRLNDQLRDRSGLEVDEKTINDSKSNPTKEQFSAVAKHLIKTRELDAKLKKLAERVDKLFPATDQTS